MHLFQTRQTLLTTIACVLLCLFASTGLAKETVVIYGDDDYPPYSYIENHEPKGIYVDILRAAFAHMKDFDVKIQMVPWKRGLKLLEEGDGFALFPPYYLPHVRKYIYPYSTPILEELVVVVCRKSIQQNRSDALWPKDYHGLLFGNNHGFHLGLDHFWQDVKDGKITVEEAPGTKHNLLKLITGRLDCYVSDRFSIIYGYDRLVGEGLAIDRRKGWPLVEGPKIRGNHGYLGYAANATQFPFKYNFVRRFNVVIEEMHAQGEIDRIVENFLNN